MTDLNKFREAFNAKFPDLAISNFLEELDQAESQLCDLVLNCARTELILQAFTVYLREKTVYDMYVDAIHPDTPPSDVVDNASGEYNDLPF